MSDNPSMKRLRRIAIGKGRVASSVTLPVWWVRSLPEEVSHIRFDELEDGRLIITPMILRELVPYIKPKPKEEPKT